MIKIREILMKKTKKATLKAYLWTPVMMITLYLLASIIFLVIFKDVATVIFFAMLALIFTISMILFAFLPTKGKRVVRIINVFLISALLFGLACILGRQNFQIEGFFFYLLTGTFGGVIVHFGMGKIIGPLLTGRSWCSWGCWTIALLDMLPYKKSQGWKKGSIRFLKYIYFFGTLAMVAIMVFVFKYIIHDPNQVPGQPGTIRAFYWFLVGNGLYYLIGLVMTIAMKDNRAFCKYLCPVSLLLKFSNLFSVLRIKGDKEKCTNCSQCVDQCMFNINIPEYHNGGERVTSSECVMCMHCIDACPTGTLKTSVGFDVVRKDRLM